MQLFNLCAENYHILQAIKIAGGTSYLVGGFVRDMVMGLPCGDADIEVHSLSLEQVSAILQQYGPVSFVGKQFGVLKLAHRAVDWSLPRTDSYGRKPKVSINPHLTITEALRRRDVTMNAMAINLNTVISHYTREELRLFQDPHNRLNLPQNDNNNKKLHIEIIDPYNGQEAIKNKQLSLIDKQRFIEDPLRFFRVMHFIGRFTMQPDAELNHVCKIMHLHDSRTQKPLAQERIHEELNKLFLKSVRPSSGFRWLQELGRLKELFPELHALAGIPQKPDYHPEGDVFEHTMQALDAAAAFPTELFGNQSSLSYDHERLLIMYAALCHDLGKPSTTNALLQSHGHEEAGIAPTRTLMKRLTRSQIFYKPVSKLVLHHMKPKMFVIQQAKTSAYKRLASKLAPETSMRHLALVSLADMRGRNGKASIPLTGNDAFFFTFIDKANSSTILDTPEAPVLQGRDLLDCIQPGPRMGKLLQEAYRIQLEENIKDPETLKERILGLNKLTN